MANDLASKIPAPMVVKYVERLKKRSLKLQSLSKSLDSEASQKEVRSIAHKIVGTAASFGFAALGESARVAEHCDASELEAALQELLAEASKAATPAPEVEADAPAKHGFRIFACAHGHDVTRIAKAIQHPERTLSHVSSFDEGLARINSEKFDLLVVGSLESGDGRDLVHACRTSEKNRDTPIIILEIEPARAVERSLLLAGADYVISKPFDQRLLERIVDRVQSRFVQLAQLAYVDSLTQLNNRSGFRRLFRQVLKGCERRGEPLALAIIDLDHFKDINDTHGHQLGDKILQQLAVVLETTLRESDVIGRWGGEEFVVALPGATPAGARIALQKCADALRERSDLDVTFSGGAVAVENAHTRSLEHWVDKADKYLYRAKQNGRNQVLIPDKAEDRPHVLVIDDDPAVHEFLRLELGAFCTLANAENTQTALIIVKQRRFDAILLDIDLGDSCGLDLLADLRQTLDSSLQPPILVITSSTDTESMSKAFAGGATDYFLKPLRRRHVAPRLLRHIG